VIHSNLIFAESIKKQGGNKKKNIFEKI